MAGRPPPTAGHEAAHHPWPAARPLRPATGRALTDGATDRQRDNRAVISLATMFLTVLAWPPTRSRLRGSRPGRVEISSSRRSTTIADNGSVRSVQSARLELPRSELERLWTPAQLENLGRTYWLFLTRVTCGLIRTVYDTDSRSVVLLHKPLTLLRFDPPEYSFGADQGRLSWTIRDGLLVSRSSASGGLLAIAVRREQGDGDRASLLIDVEVANFHPSIASRFGVRFYRATQAFVHALVAHAFLRSLATLKLRESTVRRFTAN